MSFVIPHLVFTSILSAIFAQVSQRAFDILIFDHQCSIVVSVCFRSILLQLRISFILVLLNVTEFNPFNRFCELVSAGRFAFVVRTKTSNYYVFFLFFFLFFFIAVYINFIARFSVTIRRFFYALRNSNVMGSKKKSRSEETHPPNAIKYLSSCNRRLLFLCFTTNA